MATSVQRALIWWTIAFTVIFALAWALLIKMLPLPPATETADQVAAFYRANAESIRIGAMICAWTGAFPLALATVIAIQVARLEKGTPVLGILCFAGGIMMSMFFVLPPLLWGVAAFNPGRAPDVTALMHEFANLMLVTTDQYFIFQMIPITWISLRQTQDALSPFPRWYGYFNIWIVLMFELGAIAFIPKTGPFAWNGLFTFWSPLSLFGVWIGTTSWLLLRALRRQEAHGD